MAEYPIPQHITVGEFADWSGTSSQHRDTLPDLYSCRTSFDLPFPSESLFLLSRGPVGGSVEIVQSLDRTADEGAVKVEVVARYHHMPDLDFIMVCKITRSDGGNGVGIFSLPLPSHVNVIFEVTMHLPKLSPRMSSLRVKNLETDLPLFAHRTGNFADNIDFESVSFKTSNVPIEVGSLYATNAQIVTSNSHIEGDFEISSSLRLVTSNSYIKAKVDLFNDEAAGVTNLTMSTTNAPIDASLALVSATHTSRTPHFDTGGKFKIAATTALSSLNIVFLRAPVDSVLILDAYTSLSAATVELPETYEGEFKVTTTQWNTPDLVVDNMVVDPKGEGRRRSINVERGRGSFLGTVLWANAGRNVERGVIKIGTTWGQVTLRL